MARALGLLINLSGKMRMLSHRIAMFILMRARKQSGVDAGADADRARAALTEFRAIHRALRQGDRTLGIGAEVAALIAAEGAIDAACHHDIDAFVTQAERLLAGTESASAEIEAFVSFVSGVLLERLNRLTERVGGVLERLQAGQHEASRRSEQAVLEALTAIEKVSFSVRLIAINAATEAVRAGDAGRGFSVIATEIRALSDRTSDLVNSVRSHLA